MRLPHEHLTTQRMKAPLMRSLNGIELLNLISENGPISRARLATLSRLSKPTVSSQVETLIEQGWVVELGRGQSGSKGGKKPTLIRFNADAGRLFAVELNADEIRIAAADLEGKILDRAAFPSGSDRSAGAMLDIACRELGKFIERERASAVQKVIGVASPGCVDVRRGITLQAGNVFNWTQVPIRAVLEKAFGLPVLVDNNVKMATLGELYFGIAKGMNDVVLVRLDSGIGSGIVVRGRLFHGRHWAAGEIAHMILDLGRASEDWRVRGYLESMVASDRILLEAPAGSVSAIDFLHRAKQATGDARRIFDKVVLHIGVAIANLICAYDPSVVVLQGAMLAVIADELKQVVANAVPWDTRIELSEISDEAVLLGTLAAARSLAYERIARQFNGRERAPGRTQEPVRPLS
jgi:predicted NBD/HSP70 family sugar kinase